MAITKWLVCAALVVAMAPPALSFAGEKDKVWVFIGTYTQGTKAKGIYRCELDLAGGKLSAPELAVETINPSFLAIHPSHKFLYAVGEISELNGKKTGAVNAFTLDPATGKMALLNQQSSKGAGPCHLVVDKAGKNVLVANYGGGSATVVPIQQGRQARRAEFHRPAQGIERQQKSPGSARTPTRSTSTRPTTSPSSPTSAWTRC